MSSSLWILLFLVAWMPVQGDTCPAPNTAALADQCSDIGRGEGCHTADLSLRHVQGMLPAVLPEQNLVLAWTDGAVLENDVRQDERITPAEPISVQPTVNARLRAAPSADAEIIGGAEQGTTLFADALSTDGAWVRVAWRNASAWVSRPLVTGVVAGLPTMPPDAYGDYQALRVTFETNCALLMVQPPRVTVMPVRVNEEELHINNSVVFDRAPNGGLRVSALDGGVRLPDGVRVPRGFSAMMSAETDEWLPPRPMTQAQLARYRFLLDLPPGIVNEAVRLPIGEFIRPGTGG